MKNTQALVNPPPSNSDNSKFQKFQDPPHLQLQNLIQTLKTSLSNNSNFKPSYEESSLPQKQDSKFFSDTPQKNRPDKIQNPENLKNPQTVEEILEEEKLFTNVFYQQKIPTITLEAYMMRMEKFLKVPIEVFVMSFIYLKRFKNMQNQTDFNEYTAHRLIFISTILAIKFQCDKIGDNSYLAKIGGIKKKDLAEMEKVFLKILEYKLFVTPKEYRSTYYQLLFNKVDK